MSRRPFILVIGLAVVVLGLMAAFAWMGDEGNSSREKGKAKVSRSLNGKAWLDEIGEFCKRATVAKGAAAGEIEFTVECRSNSPAIGRFSVVRYTDQGRAVPDVQSVQLHPMVKYPGGGNSRGRCRIRLQRIACQAQIDGVSQVQGRFWVNPDQRCALRVGVSVIQPPQCGSATCELVLSERFLTRRRPDGC